MNNNDLILSGWESEKKDALLSNPDLHKFVREINFTYKLKVFTIVKALNDVMKVGMCTEQGLPVCYLWTRTGDGASDIEYCFSSPYYRKQRGRTHDERETVFSSKLPSLMATLKRNNCIPTKETLESEIFKVFEKLIGTVKSTICKESKSTYGVEPNEMHTLLKIAFEEASPNALGNHDTTKLRNLLIKWNEVDRKKEEMKAAITENYNKGFYAIGVFHNGDYLVGQLKRSIVLAGTEKKVKYEFIKPFKRTKDLTQETELIPALTMMKVSLERRPTLEYRGNDIKFPENHQFYDENVGIVFSDPQGRGLLNYTMAMIPCSLI